MALGSRPRSSPEHQRKSREPAPAAAETLGWLPKVLAQFPVKRPSNRRFHPVRSEDSLMNHVFSGTECTSKTWMCNFKNLTCPFHLGSEEDNHLRLP